MAIYYYMYFLVLGGIVPAGIDDPRWRRLLQKIYVPFLLFALLLFASLRSPTVDRDYLNYLAWFDAIATGGMTALDWIKDPGFVLVLRIAAALKMSYVGATFALVALALAGTVRFAWITSKNNFLTIFIYLVFCRFFLAQEMTAIRAGVAIPLLSLSIFLMYRGQKKLATVLFLIAVSFHLTALLALPIVLLAMCQVRLKSYWWMGAMIPTVILLRISAQSILNAVSQLDRISPYLNGSVEIGSINVHSVYLLAHVWVMSLVVCFLWKKMSPEERLSVFCSGIGLSVLLLFSFNSTIALRSSELFGLFDVVVFLIPMNYLKRSQAHVYLFVLVVFGAAFFISDLSIVQPYRWVLG